MADLLEELTSIVIGTAGTGGTYSNGIIPWIGEIASTIVSTPILLLTTGFLVLGGAIGIFGRLLSKG